MILPIGGAISQKLEVFTIAKVAREDNVRKFPGTTQLELNLED